VRKIALVGTDLAPLRAGSGALERIVLAWGEALAAAGDRVLLLDGDRPGGPPLAELERERPDLVVLNNRPLWGERLGRGPAVLNVMHNYEDAWGDGSGDSTRVSAALGRGTVAAVSPTLARHIERRFAPGRPVRPVATPIDDCFFATGWAGGEGIILFPNRLLEKKGVRLFLEVARLLSGRDRRFVLFRHLAPFPEPTVEQLALLEAVASSGAVELLGPPADRREMAAWYRRASAVLCPSLRPEGLGLAALEAQAVGAPLVTSGLGGLADATFSPNEVVAEPDPERWAAATARAEQSDRRLVAPRVRREHGPAVAAASFLAAASSALSSMAEHRPG
jgi:glycosyltransferase involved in cell wall biosynthesis